MRSKYELDSFAVYKGKIYSAYTKNGFIRLRTYDIKEVESGEFESFNATCATDLQGIKEVSPYEVTEYYEQRFKAVYKDIPVSIIVGDDDSVEIENTNLPWTVLKKAGFEVVNKGEYSKLVKTSELTDLHAIKEDLLEYAKQDFDEANKKKTVWEKNE